MKKLSLIVLMLSIWVPALRAQVPSPLSPVPTYSSAAPVNTLPKVCGFEAGGTMVYCPSNVTDSGTQLLYNGQPIGGGSLPTIPNNNLLGNNSGATGAAAALTAAQVSTILGLGTAATQAASAFDAAGAASAAQAASLQKANNLSDLANAATARTSLGLGTAATSAASAFDAAGSAAAAQATAESFATTSLAGAINPSSTGVTAPGPGDFTTINASASLSIGSSPPTACGSATGCWAFNDNSVEGTPTAGQSYIRAGAGSFIASVNGSTPAAIPLAGGSPGAFLGAYDGAALAANVSATTIYTTPSTACSVTAGAITCRYQVCAMQNLTQAATTSSTLPGVTINYTSQDDSAVRDQSVAFTQTWNATYGTQSACIGIYAKPSTTIQVQSSGYTSSGATPMQYSLHAWVQSANSNGQ